MTNAYPPLAKWITLIWMEILVLDFFSKQNPETLLYFLWHPSRNSTLDDLDRWSWEEFGCVLALKTVESPCELLLYPLVTSLRYSLLWEPKLQKQMDLGGVNLESGGWQGSVEKQQLWVRRKLSCLHLPSPSFLRTLQVLEVNMGSYGEIFNWIKYQFTLMAAIRELAKSIEILEAQKELEINVGIYCCF